VTVRFTHLNCKVETTFTLLVDAALNEHITLSVDPTCPLSLMIEESVSFPPSLPKRGTTRVRATKHGFEIYDR
jgi:hypothetical protein